MKRLYIVLLIALFTTSSYTAQSIFLGTLQFPSKIETPAPFPLYYKGSDYTPKINKDTLLCKKATFEIYEDRNTSEFYLLIGRVKFPETADFESLETEGEYRFFKFTRASKIKEFVTTSTTNDKPIIAVEPRDYWIIEELPCHEDTDEKAIIQRKLPKNTIILYTLPTFISRIEAEEWRPDDIYIKLPKIIFDETIPEKVLQDESSKMLCAAPDLRCLHPKITKTIKPYGQNCIISVRDPLNCYISYHNARI